MISWKNGKIGDSEQSILDITTIRNLSLVIKLMLICLKYSSNLVSNPHIKLQQECRIFVEHILEVSQKQYFESSPDCSILPQIPDAGQGILQERQKNTKRSLLCQSHE